MIKAFSWLQKEPLRLLLLAFTVLVLIHSFSTPIYEAPDEVWHDAYVRWLALGNGLPSMLNNDSGANQEVAQPPLYYTAASLLRWPWRNADTQDLLYHNPGFGYQSSGISGDNKNMLVHPRGIQGAAEIAVRVTRLTSLAFGWLAVIATYKLGELVTGNKRGALITGAVLAFHPQFVFLSGVVSNDSAATALAAMGLWLAARILQRGLTWKRTLVLGAVCGLASLSKTSALLLSPLLGMLLVYWCWRVRLPRHIWLPSLVSFGGAALITGGWWYVRNWGLYGDPLGLSNHVGTLWGRAETLPLWQLLPELPLLIRSFWASYGWGHVTWPDGVPWALSLVNIALLLYGARGWRVRLQRLVTRNTAPHRTALMRWTALAWFSGIGLALLRWMTQVQAPHGRLLFPALSGWAVLTAGGLLALARNRKTHHLAKLYLLVLFCVTALAPGARLLATFAPPKLRTALPDGFTALDWRVGESIKLAGVSVPETYFKSGDAVPVGVCWRTLVPIDNDYTVFVHLLGPETARYGERHTWPGLGRYPTSQWQPGTLFCETYEITVEDYTWPLLSQLEVGLFDAETGARLIAVDAQGNNHEPPVVAQVPLVSAGAKLIKPLHKRDVNYLELPPLSVHNLPVAAQPGDTIRVDLHWQPEWTVAIDYTVFVHVWNPGMDAPLAQHDTVPAEGWYPTRAWLPNDTVRDLHSITVPDDAPPGSYGIWVGMYVPFTGERVPVDDSYGFNMEYLGELVVE